MGQRPTRPYGLEMDETKCDEIVLRFVARRTRARRCGHAGGAAAARAAKRISRRRGGPSGGSAEGRGDPEDNPAAARRGAATWRRIQRQCGRARGPCSPARGAEQRQAGAPPVPATRRTDQRRGGKAGGAEQRQAARSKGRRPCCRARGPWPRVVRRCSGVTRTAVIAARPVTRAARPAARQSLRVNGRSPRCRGDRSGSTTARRAARQRDRFPGRRDGARGAQEDPQSRSTRRPGVRPRDTARDPCCSARRPCNRARRIAALPPDFARSERQCCTAGSDDARRAAVLHGGRRCCTAGGGAAERRAGLPSARAGGLARRSRPILPGGPSSIEGEATPGIGCPGMTAHPYTVELHLSRSVDDSVRPDRYDLELVDGDRVGTGARRKVGIAFLDLRAQEIPDVALSIERFLEHFLAGSAGTQEDGLRFGQHLLGQLLSDLEVRLLWEEIQGRRRAQKRPLRLELILPADDAGLVSDVPFELLADETGFLFRQSGAALVRAIRKLPLRDAELHEGDAVLVAWANPKTAERLPQALFDQHEDGTARAAEAAGLSPREPCRQCDARRAGRAARGGDGGRLAHRPRRHRGRGGLAPPAGRRRLSGRPRHSGGGARPGPRLPPRQGPARPALDLLRRPGQRGLGRARRPPCSRKITATWPPSSPRTRRCGQRARRGWWSDSSARCGRPPAATWSRRSGRRGWRSARPISSGRRRSITRARAGGGA